MKYYWLKLKDDFFNQKEIKKLRKIAGGDTFTIIYLKLQLLSIKKEGILSYDGTEKDLAEQLSYEIDEDVDNIEITLSFLWNNNLIEKVEDNDYLLPKVIECIGKESESAERVRKHRERKALATKQEQLVLPQNDNFSLQCNAVVTESNTEKREKRKEKEININNDVKIIFDKWNSTSVGINHRNIDDFITPINNAIKIHGVNNILNAIDRLDSAYTDSNFYYNTKWNLKNWLKQSNGISNWLDEGQYYNDHASKQQIINKSIPTKPTTPPANVNVDDIINNLRGEDI